NPVQPPGERRWEPPAGISTVGLPTREAGGSRMLDGFEVPLFLNGEKGEFMLGLRDGVFPDRHNALLELSVAHLTAKLQKEENMDLKEAVKKIHWLGHDAVRIDGSTVVLVDPIQILDTTPADLIL